MDKLVIEGGVPLKGTVTISGSKNAALPILLASILVEGEVRLSNVPDLRDIGTTLKLLELLGCTAEYDGGEVLLKSCDLKPEAPYELVRTMRASVLCLGPLLARLGRARVALPGGCAIGARPVDMHLKGLEQMGAVFELESGDIIGNCDRLKGAHIQLDFPTVGGTEHLIMAATLAEGETVLENAAREPEIQDLAEFLNSCGAKISGHGTSVVRIQGVESLHGTSYRVMPDRIEAGTYLVAAGITKGDLTLKDCPVDALDAVIFKLKEMGMVIEGDRDTLRATVDGPLNCVDLSTRPYPGFPTDMQAQIMALMCVSRGAGVITEGIFENRFMHVQELARLGAHISLSGQSAMVRGVDSLKGATVMASDLRASACLVLAGLAATGRTDVRRIYHLDRGYEQMEVKLGAVGARIVRKQE
ncbi:UDP-N-acetylglucosamine 1-carboxyvinyltransferase [anaerobic digester metagenome]